MERYVEENEDHRKMFVFRKEWSALKEEYLDQQRTNMKNLKEQLRTAARNKKKKNKQNDGDAENGQGKEGQVWDSHFIVAF